MMTAPSPIAPAQPPRAAAPGSTWSATADRVLGNIVEIPAAILVAAEVVVLLCGIVARYVLHQPLTWSDELASLLFLWLAMLGAVIALRRGEHMRMTALVWHCKDGGRDFFDALGVAAGLGFLILVTVPAYHWASEEAFITTPAMEISAAWRAAAFPIGVGLMISFSLLRLVTRTNLVHAALALAIVGAVILVFWWLGPTLRSLGNLNLAIFFVGVVGVSVFSGVPIVFSFALATFGYLALTTRVPTATLVGRMDEGMSHLILLAVPLFVFLGLLIEMTGMAKAMVRFLASLLGHVRGGIVLRADRRHVLGVWHLRL
jgi:TRAP-type C4-dicarboxylate transport system permease small subunit